MNSKVMQITLVVKDQEKALNFYTKQIGFEKKTDFTPPGGNRWVTVGPASQELEIALFQAGSGDPNGWSDSWSPGKNPPIVLRVEDCAKAFDELSSHGVVFHQERPVTYPWGISATFADPDGNLFSINQLPEPTEEKK